MHSKKYFPALTGVRAVAAYLVFFHHFNPFQNEKTGIGLFAKQVLDQGYIGVQLFFVLSGFLITIRYKDSVNFSWKWWIRYMQNRIARIYPIYFFITVITFCAIYAGWMSDPIGQWPGYTRLDKLIVFGLNITFLKGYFSQFKFSGIAQGWSLTVEETFYVVIPFILISLRSSKFWLLLSPIIIIGVGLFFVKIGHYIPFGFFETIRFMMNYTFFGRCMEFCLGILLALFFRKYSTINTNWVITICAFLGYSLCIAGLVYFNPIVPNMHGAYGIGLFFTNLLVPIVFTVLLAGLLYENNFIVKFLETDVMNKLGKSSYVFYLIHMGVFKILLDGFIYNIYIKFFVLIIMSLFIWYFIEEKIHKKLKANKKYII